MHATLIESMEFLSLRDTILQESSCKRWGIRYHSRPQPPFFTRGATWMGFWEAKNRGFRRRCGYPLCPGVQVKPLGVSRMMLVHLRLFP
jgi:hypothetical protein